MHVIGLTGGIATGKSTVSNYLRAVNIPVIDADLISREIVQPGSPGLRKLVETFGIDLMTSDGCLNRPALAQKIFHNESMREQVNQLLHPLIYQRMSDQVAQYRTKGERLVVLDIPLLFETKSIDWFDTIWLVYIPETIQLERLMKRDSLSEESAVARIASQLSIEEKKGLADVIIDNTGSIEETIEQVQTVLNSLDV